MMLRARPVTLFLSRLNWRLIAYWTFTLLVAFENLSGSIWALLRIDYIRMDLAHLGYPQYFLAIVGTGQFLIAVALLLPGFAVAKEWAYAGATLNYSAALTSHLIVGDRHAWIFPLIYIALALASWVLRPPDRRARTAPRVGEIRATAWLVPVILLLVFGVVAVVTLPTAPPQY